MIAGAFNNLSSIRQDDAFVARLSVASRAVVHDALKNGAGPATADNIEELAHLFSATQQAAVEQSRAVLDEAVGDLNQERTHLSDAEDVVKNQSMHVCPTGFLPTVSPAKQIGQLVLHRSPEEAFFSDKNLPHSEGVSKLEHKLAQASKAARAGDSETAGRLLNDADLSLGLLVSRPAEPVPILAGRGTLREEERYSELKLAHNGRGFRLQTVLGDPTVTLFVPAQGGLPTDQVPLAPRQLAVMENLPPHLDVADR